MRVVLPQRHRQLVLLCAASPAGDTALTPLLALLESGRAEVEASASASASPPSSTTPPGHAVPSVAAAASSLPAVASSSSSKNSPAFRALQQRLASLFARGACSSGSPSEAYAAESRTPPSPLEAAPEAPLTAERRDLPPRAEFGTLPGRWPPQVAFALYCSMLQARCR